MDRFTFNQKIDCFFSEISLFSEYVKQFKQIFFCFDWIKLHWIANIEEIRDEIRQDSPSKLVSQKYQ